MRYQYYIVGRETAPNHYDLRRFTMPVHSVGGQWVAASDPTEETHLCNRFDLLMDVDEFQVHTDNTAGKLDDLPCPDGWRVLARDWLPDDYAPPTPEEVEQQRAEAIEHLKKLGVWRDPS